jgi:hypothetical protein
MKLFEIANNNDDIPQELIDKIRNECRPFLSQSDAPLWRGLDLDSPSVKRLSDNVLYGKVRKDRRAKDSDAHFSKVINDFLKKQSGIDYRSQSLFTTFSQGVAASYGNRALMIFPVGNFNYAWSDILKDPYGNIELEPAAYWPRPLNTLALAKMEAEEITEDDLEKDIELKATIFADVIRDMDTLYYYDEGLRSAAKTNSEIMIHCDNYYAVLPEVHPQKFMDMLTKGVS